jgi:hypothetical protein
MAARQDAVPPVEAVDEGEGWLDASWVVLPAEVLPGLPGRTLAGERRFVLLHPARGMAILDLWSPVKTLSDEEITASLDAEITLAGFLRRFDPRLPVRRIHLAHAELHRLAGAVARSYAGTPPLELPESWMDAVRSTLAVPQTPMDRAGLAIPRRRIAGRYRLAAGIAALVTAGAVGLLAVDADDVAPRAQPAPIAAEASTPRAPASPTMLAIAVPEQAPFPAAPPRPASAEPRPEPAAVTPPSPVAGRIGVQADPLQGAAPGSAEPSPAVPPDTARVDAAAAAEGAADRPSAVPPQRIGRPGRIARPAVPARFSQGSMPNSSGSFIRQQSQQYATGNGG